MKSNFGFEKDGVFLYKPFYTIKCVTAILKSMKKSYRCEQSK